MPVPYKKISPFDSSFQIVRTNPKLTGNVKLTVDSASNIWLNSIDANDELSKDRYKKYAIDPKIGHEAHVYNFFNQGKTPSQIIYDLREQVGLSDASRNFEDQYDFSNYFSGARYLASKFYNEKFSYFAPLYLDQQLPEFFVVFKLPGAANYTVTDSKNKFPFDKAEFTYDTFANAEIINVIDLGEHTKVGQYLRNILNNPMLPNSPLRVGFQKDQLTYFRGLSVKSGTYTEIGENLYDFYRDAQPIVGFEERITLGFERNMVLHPYIINMEFLFNDPTSNPFEINRYVGFYCNLIEVEKLRIDLAKHADRKVTSNTPLFKRKYAETENISILQENANGVDVFFTPTTDLTDLDNSNSDNKDVFFPVLRDQDDFLYLIKRESIKRDPIDSSMKLKLVNNSIDLGKFFGPDELFLQERSISVNVKGTSYAEILFTQNLGHLDRFRLYHNNGTRVDSRGVYDEFTAVSTYDLAPEPGDFYAYYDYQNDLGDHYFFNVGGTIEKMVDTIVRTLNAVKTRAFTAYAFENRVFIKANSPGNSDKSFSLYFDFLNIESYDTTKVFEITGQIGLEKSKINFRGGGPGFQLTMDARNYEKIKANADRLLVKTKQGWSKIVNVSNYAAIINETTSETRIKRLQALAMYDSRLAIQLENGHVADIKFGLSYIREYFRPRIGVLSLFNVKDFDFDRISSDYISTPVIDLYKDFYVPENEPLLMTNQTTYRSVGTGKFEIGETQYSVRSQSSYITVSNIGDNLSYRVIDGDCFLIEEEDAVKLTQGIYDKNGDQKNFSGFASIKSADAVKTSTEEVHEYRDKFTNGSVASEYDFNNENNTVAYALKSKLIPYISKWAMLDGRDVRDNPYRLNTDLAFGINNFTPDHFETVPNSDKMTHEWFYIESSFNYKNSANLLNLNKYYFDKKLNLDANDGINSVLHNETGFEDFFTYTPVLDGVEVGPSQFRYSLIKKDRSEDATFFKGINFKFREVSPLGTTLANGKPTFVENSRRFADYKFSTILKVVEDDPRDNFSSLVDADPITYRMIEHKTFKWITFVIEIRLNGLNTITADALTKDLNNALNIVTPNEVLFRTENNSVKLPWERYPNDIYNDVYGDYRIDFDADGISNLTHAFLYYAKHKKFNNATDRFSTVKLGNKLDFSTSGIDNLPTGVAINRIDTKYFLDIRDEIRTGDGASVVFLKMPNNSADLLVNRSQAANNIINAKDIPFVEDVKFNKVFTQNVADITINGLASSSNYQIPSSSSNYWSRFVNFQLLGGKGYYENLFKYISLAFVKKAVNNLSPIIKYQTYEYGNGTVAEYDNQFYVEIEDPEFIDKTSLMSSEPETLDLAVSTTIDASRASKDFPNRVGFELFANALTSPYSLNRHSGEYEVLFKNVSCYKSEFAINSLGEKFKFANIGLNSNYKDLFEIKNFNHVKVSDVSILGLANDSKYSAVYPLIGEVPVGAQPYFLFSSNWDFGFHHLYKDKVTSVPVSGTLRIGEDSSFLSKLVNLPDSIDLIDFALSEEEISRLNNIYSFKELVYEEGASSVSGIINISEVIVRYFLNSSLKTTILNIFRDENGNIMDSSAEFFGARNSTEYVRAYILANIVSLYKIDGIEFYNKPQKGVISVNAEVKNVNPNRVDFISLTDSQRFNQGFFVNKNLEINKLSDLLIKFKINKPVDSSLLVSPKIKIKLI